MVKSMTGYGRAEETVNGCTITVELRSVNNRYLDCNVRIPGCTSLREESIKAGCRTPFPGERWTCSVTLDGARGRGGAGVCEPASGPAVCQRLAGTGAAVRADRLPHHTGDALPLSGGS